MNWPLLPWSRPAKDAPWDLLTTEQKVERLREAVRYLMDNVRAVADAQGKTERDQWL